MLRVPLSLCLPLPSSAMQRSALNLLSPLPPSPSPSPASAPSAPAPAKKFLQILFSLPCSPNPEIQGIYAGAFCNIFFGRGAGAGAKGIVLCPPRKARAELNTDSKNPLSSIIDADPAVFFFGKKIYDDPI